MTTPRAVGPLALLTIAALAGALLGYLATEPDPGPRRPGAPAWCARVAPPGTGARWACDRTHHTDTPTGPTNHATTTNEVHHE